MGKSRLLTFGILVLVLTMVTSTMVASTYAKYTTSASATATVTVAKWVADFKDDASTNFTSNTFNLFGTAWPQDTGVDGQKLAPGTLGTFDVYYDTSGSQTSRDIKVTLTGAALSSLTHLKFYTGTTTSGGTDITSAVLAGTEGNLLNTSFAAIDSGAGLISVTWWWPFGGDDTEDIADGLTPLTNVNVAVNFKAEQLDN